MQLIFERVANQVGHSDYAYDFDGDVIVAQEKYHEVNPFAQAHNSRGVLNGTLWRLGLPENANGMFGLARAKITIPSSVVLEMRYPSGSFWEAMASLLPEAHSRLRDGLPVMMSYGLFLGMLEACIPSGLPDVQWPLCSYGPSTNMYAANYHLCFRCQEP